MPNCCDRISSEWEPSMGEVTTIGLDLAKHVFQVHGVDAEGATVLRKQLRRAQVLDQLVGAWTLVSTKYKFPDGKTVDTFGPNPRGTLILDASGRMALINMRTSLPKFAANDRTKGTPEENKAIVEGNFVVFGTYTVNESDHTLITHSHRFDLLLESRLRQ